MGRWIRWCPGFWLALRGSYWPDDEIGILVCGTGLASWGGDPDSGKLAGSNLFFTFLLVPFGALNFWPSRARQWDERGQGSRPRCVWCATWSVPSISFRPGREHGQWTMDPRAAVIDRRRHLGLKEDVSVPFSVRDEGGVWKMILLLSRQPCEKAVKDPLC